MRQHPYGTSGLLVSALGLGAGQIGDAALDEAAVARLLNTALDCGVTLIDTARGYGESEARIGRHLAHRRHEFVLSTKVGYGIPGVPDWTPACISAGINTALQRLNCETIDIVHLHSCDLATLQHSGVVEALLAAREAGKLRFVAYSGENAALAWAVECGLFGGVECSVNPFDQASLASTLPLAQERGLGVIAKRPLGNAPWRFAERPVGHYAQTYWQRLQQLAFDTNDLEWDEFALRFSAFQPGVSCAIVGTSSLAHLAHNVGIVARGPLPDEVVAAVRARFVALGSDWAGEI